MIDSVQIAWFLIILDDKNGLLLDSSNMMSYMTIIGKSDDRNYKQETEKIALQLTTINCKAIQFLPFFICLIEHIMVMHYYL